MSICAFDIGIKNLSYCIIHNENDLLTVADWKLLNLTTSKSTCIGRNRDGSICGKISKLSHKTNLQISYCPKHSSQYIPVETPIVNLKNKKKCSFQISDEEICSKQGDKSFNKKCYCNAHIKKLHTQETNANKLCNIKFISCMREPLYDLGTHMYQELDQYPDILKVDKIVIENQPSIKNPTMKSISILLLSYFIFHKHKCVEFIAPSGKLKINETLTKSILSRATSANKYKITKELGIKYTEELLKSFEKSDELFLIISESKKKDDLCDAFLHAYFHFIGKTGLDKKDFIENTNKYFEEKFFNKKVKNKKKSEEETIKLDI